MTRKQWRWLAWAGPVLGVVLGVLGSAWGPIGFSYGTERLGPDSGASGNRAICAWFHGGRFMFARLIPDAAHADPEMPQYLCVLSPVVCVTNRVHLGWKPQRQASLWYGMFAQPRAFNRTDAPALSLPLVWPAIAAAGLVGWTCPLRLRRGQTRGFEMVTDARQVSSAC